MRGPFCLAAATMPRPSGPQPAITTTSSDVMSPRLTAWIEHANGSTNTASNGSISAGTL